MKRAVLVLVGLAATGLGIVGVWVPGMPTTVFILIALWAFSQVSPQLERWLMSIPVLKQAVLGAKRFQREGTVSRSSKIVSQSCSWISFIAVSVTLQNVVASVIVGLLAVSCSVFMWWVPTAMPAHATETD